MNKWNGGARTFKNGRKLYIVETSLLGFFIHGSWLEYKTVGVDCRLRTETKILLTGVDLQSTREISSASTEQDQGKALVSIQVKHNAHVYLNNHFFRIFIHVPPRWYFDRLGKNIANVDKNAF
jgi:hypothetical protein